jgi:hypothetical membrane protein
VTLPSLPRVPWWGLAAAVVAPVALVGGWWWSAALTPGYDPIRQPVSDLAAGDAPTRWLMTAALVVTGVAYIVAAVGLRPADGAGRGLLGVGGGAVLLTAWISNATPGRNAVGHMIVTYLAFVTLTVWPAVIARNRPDAPLVLRRRFGQVVALGLGVLVLLTVAEIVVGGSTLGLRERTLTTAQALVPLVVVLGCRSLRSAA